MHFHPSSSRLTSSDVTLTSFGVFCNLIIFPEGRLVFLDQLLIAKLSHMVYSCPENEKLE